VSAAELFLRPEAYPVLLLVPAAGLLLLVLDRRRERRLREALGPRGEWLAAERSRPRRSARRRLFTAGLLLAAVGMLQPVWGEVPVRERRGVDVVLCLDVSRSMLARDVAPSRLERAKREIAAVCARAAGDRLGLVLFAGEARLAAPLTTDANAVAELAGRADPLSVGRGGTDLAGALRTAVLALEDRTGPRGFVLLLTDGDDPEARAAAVAETGRGRDVVVHVLGFGSPRGAKIPIEGEDGETYLTDREGREVVTALHEGRLRRIAEATEGAFETAGAEPGALSALYEDEVLASVRADGDAEGRRQRENRYQWPLLAALLLWILDLCLIERRKP